MAFSHRIPGAKMRAVTLLMLALQVHVAALTEDAPVVVSLSGVRQAEVTISGDRDAFDVAVRMKPIQCFDKVTNERLNVQKARAYSLQGLLKHLSGGEKNVKASASGITLTETGYDGEFYRLTLRIQRDRFEIVSNPEVRQLPRRTSNPSQIEEIQVNSSLLTCFGDLSATIEQLVSFYDQELDQVRSSPLEVGADFEIAIVELEERLTAWFDQFEKDVHADNLLLAAEQTELLDRVVSARKRCLQELKSAVEQRDRDRTEKNGSAEFSSVEIEAEFDVYLRSNPLVMEVAGSKIIRRKDGSTVVIAVGSTAMNSDSAKERLRAEKVCRVKALASLVAEKQGVQVAHVEELKDETVVVLENGTEKATNVMDLLKITKAKVDGIARDMPVIGRWRSADGDIYYLAIGAFLDEEGDSLPNSAQ